MLRATIRRAMPRGVRFDVWRCTSVKALPVDSVRGIPVSGSMLGSGSEYESHSRAEWRESIGNLSKILGPDRRGGGFREGLEGNT